VTPSEPQFYGLSIHFQLLSTSCRQDAVTFRYWPVSSSQRGTLTLLRTFTFKRTSPAASAPGNPTTSDSVPKGRLNSTGFQRMPGETND
jgi:hypothetical protein